jgi:hypothetical protein
VENSESSPPSLNETPGNRWSSFASRAESFAKAGAAVGVLCYAVGLIVSNTYLTKYGVTDFGLLQPQCILTGCWTIIIISLAALPSVAAAALLTPNPNLRGGFRGRALALAAAGITLTLAYLAIVVIGIILVNPVERSFNANLPGWNLTLGLMNTLPLFLIITRPETYADLRGDLWNVAILFLPFAFISCFVIGRNMYEVVAPEMGGGRPQHGQLYIAAEDKELLARARLLTAPYHDNDPEGAISGDMVYMGSDRYAFRVTYCGPSEDWAASKEVVYKEQNFIADKKTMQSFFLEGLAERKKDNSCPFKH